MNIHIGQEGYAMGLDITAYSRLNHIGRHAIDPALNEGESGPHCYYENHVDAFAYDSFPESYRGLPVIGTSTHGGTGFMVSGCFEETPETEVHGFRAGSYGGYNQWRENLQQQFNPERLPDGPFYELIWFADNEGCIGPDAARDLHIDFAQHADKYRALHVDEDSWYVGKYDDWTRAFDLAAQDGLVRFH
jgi:hypothetical protein